MSHFHSTWRVSLENFHFFRVTDRFVKRPTCSFFSPTSSFPHYSAVLCVNQLQFVLLYYSLDTIELRILLSLDFQRFVLDFSRQVNPEIVISHVRERIITEE